MLGIAAIYRPFLYYDTEFSVTLQLYNLYFWDEIVTPYHSVQIGRTTFELVM
jgi:hypothetical protein